MSEQTRQKQPETVKIRSFGNFGRQIISLFLQIDSYTKQTDIIEAALETIPTKFRGVMLLKVRKACTEIIAEQYRLYTASLAGSLDLCLRSAVRIGGPDYKDIIEELAKYCTESINRNVLGTIITMCEGMIGDEKLIESMTGHIAGEPGDYGVRRRAEAIAKFSNLLNICAEITSFLET